MSFERKTRLRHTAVGLIPEDWAEKAVGDFVDLKHGYAFKGEFFTEEPTEHVVVTPGNFEIGGGFKAEKFRYTKEDYASEYVLHKGDIIVTMTDLSKNGDTLGYAAKVPASGKIKYLHNQRIGLLKFKSPEIVSDFLYWVLRTKRYNQYVVGSASGSTVKHTSPDRIKAYSFGMPSSKEEQRRIAALLCGFDAKIEHDKKMNRTLEAIGQAAFKRWFVDFEFPNEEGKLYKSSGGEMIESELGDIPQNWAVSTLADMTKISLGGTPKRAEPRYWGGNVLWATAGTVASSPSLYILTTNEKITSDGVANSNAKVLPAETIVVTARGTVGEIRLLGVPGSVNQTCYALVSKDETSTHFLYYLLKASIEQMKSLSYGTVFETITTKTFEECKVIKPTQIVIQRFNGLVAPLFQRIKTNTQETAALSQIRDSLLPKLMSGKIRVPVPKKEVEAY
jgi:type I restriction enzyme S subunit